MRIFLYILVGMIFGAILTTVTAISTWQWWVLMLMWAYSDPIDRIIDNLMPKKTP